MYEYKVLDHQKERGLLSPSLEELENQMNELANDGWILVTFGLSAVQMGTGHAVSIWKREKQV